jgi:hypothetical protein
MLLQEDLIKETSLWSLIMIYLLIITPKRLTARLISTESEELEGIIIIN